MRPSPPNQILELLFLYPQKQFSFRDIERRTESSIGTISKYVHLLFKEDLIIIDKRPTATYVSGNQENNRFKHLKRVSNLKQLYETGLINHIRQESRPDCIVLFGSYAKGEDTEESDIDLALINGKNFRFLRKSFEKKLKRNINLHAIQELRKISKEFKSALYNGFVLEGFLEL